MSCLVSEPFADDARHRVTRPLAIVAAKGFPVVIPEIELCQIPV